METKFSQIIKWKSHEFLTPCALLTCFWAVSYMRKIDFDIHFYGDFQAWKDSERQLKKAQIGNCFYIARDIEHKKKVRQWSRRGNWSFKSKKINFNCTFSTFVNISKYFWYLSTNFAKYIFFSFMYRNPIFSTWLIAVKKFLCFSNNIFFFRAHSFISVS